MLMAIMQSSKLQFLFANEQKQLARVLPESSAVICAKFGGVFANSTATQEKRLSFFGVWGGFFKKKPHILIQTISPINHNLARNRTKKGEPILMERLS